MVAGALGFDTGSDGMIARIFMDKDGGLKPEHFVNVTAACIILFQVIVSILNAKIKPLIAIMVGIFLTALSFAMIGIFGANPWLIILGVAIFSFGEMMASPRAKEYTAHAVAPKEKVGMYMGYYMWSNALGSLFGGLLSGALYKQIAQDMHNPTMMWLVFAGLSVFCCFLIYIYHVRVGRSVEASG